MIHAWSEVINEVVYIPYCFMQRALPPRCIPSAPGVTTATAEPILEVHPGELAHLRAETNRRALPLAPPAVPLGDSSPLQLHQVEAGPPAWQVGATGRAAWGELQGCGVPESSQGEFGGWNG